MLTTETMLEQTLDLIPYGLINATADLFVLSQNRAAGSLIAAGQGLSITNGQLACTDVRSHQRLERIVRRIADSPADALNRGALRVPRESKGADLLLSVTQLGPAGNRPNSVQTFCISVFDQLSQRSLSAEILRDLHGLTRTELEVAAALYRGLTIDDTAGDLGVSINTVKTHLKHIFQKCEVRSQGELLQMLALGPK